MKISEANITDLERAYRAYKNLILVVAPSYKLEELYVHKTTRGNWAVRLKETGKTIRILSKHILHDELVDAYELNKI